MPRMTDTNLLDLINAGHMLTRPTKFEKGQQAAILKSLEFFRDHSKTAKGMKGGIIEIKPGGGKTLPLATIALLLAKFGKKVLIVSPTGEAFNNIKNHFAENPKVDKQKFMADKLSVDENLYKDFCSTRTHMLRTKSSPSNIRSFPILYTHIDYLFRMIKHNDKTIKTEYLNLLKTVVDVVLVDEWHTLSFFRKSPSFKQTSVLASICDQIPFIGFTGNVVDCPNLVSIYKGVGRPTRTIVAHLIEFKDEGKLITTKKAHQQMMNGASPELLAAACFTALKDYVHFMPRNRFPHAKMLIFKNGVDTHAKFIDQLNNIAISNGLEHPFRGGPINIRQFTPELCQAPDNFDILVSDQAGRESLDIPEIVMVVDLGIGTEMDRIVQTARRAARMHTNTSFEFGKMCQVGHYYAPSAYKATLDKTSIKICGTSAIDYYENYHDKVLQGMFEILCVFIPFAEEKAREEKSEEEESAEDDDDEKGEF